MSATADSPDQLSFAGIHFGLSPPQADGVHIIDENEQFLGEESAETLAMEMIEDSCARLLEYVYGRPASWLTFGDWVLPGDTMFDLT